jgi:hypothetical protein
LIAAFATKAVIDPCSLALLSGRYFGGNVGSMAAAIEPLTDEFTALSGKASAG